jgi:hypothetical protein
VNERRLHRFHIQKLNQKKLNELEGKEKYRVEISNRDMFHDGWSKLLDQRKQDMIEIKGDNLNNVRRGARRRFRNKREYLNDKINEHIRDLYRGINKLKIGYQPRSNLVKDENCDLLADPDILNR